MVTQEMVKDLADRARRNEPTRCEDCGQNAVRLIEFYDGTSGFGEHHSGTLAYCDNCGRTDVLNFVVIPD